MNTALNPLDVAKMVVLMQYQANRPQTHLGLQKLVFYCHAYHLAFLDTPLLSEKIEAWPYGPVIRSIYTEYSKFGSNIIHPTEHNFSELGFNPNTMRIMSLVLSKYGSFSPMELVNLTHQEAPWQEYYKPGESAVIPDEAIKDFYRKFITKAN